MTQVFEGWIRDFRHAGRKLLRTPAFTAVAVGTLALGIGANTAIFSVVNAVLLDPLAFSDPDRLVSLRGTAPGSDLPEEFGLGGEFLVEYRENATLLEDIGFYGLAQTTVSGDGQVDRLFISPGSPSLFSTLGVTPVLGRLPTDQDPEGEVVVISHRLWTQWAGADPEVLGRAYQVSGGPRTVIGVMGPDFSFPDERVDVWLHDLVTEPIRPGGFGLAVIGRMTPTADVETLAAELDQLATRLPERFGGSPAYARIIEQFRPVVRSLEEELVGDFSGPLMILMGTVGIVLLIACANVANLLIVRAEGRRHDIAVRRALGEVRSGLVRAQMAEVLLLAAGGGVAGILIAWLGLPLLVRAAPESIPRLASVGIDGGALLFTVAVATVAACASGLLPAVRFSNPDLASTLQSSRRVGSGPGRLTRNALVVVQTAAALVLLVGSGLLLQSFRALHRVDPGYDTQDIFTFQAAPDPEEFGLVDGPTFAQFHYTFMDRIAAIPGVESVGLVNTLPLDEGAGRGPFEIDGSPAGTTPTPVSFTFASADYFRTMGIDILAGSDFGRDPNPSEEARAIVSRAAAELLWPGENPLGKRLRPAGAPFPFLVVGGVVEDIMLTDFRQAQPDPMIYAPMVGVTARAWSVGTPAYVVKTARAETIAPEIREILREMAPNAPLYRVFTMRALAARSMASLSFTMLTLSVAATLALILGAIGLYGTLSYVVAQRTREIGIRMALGAQVEQVRRMVVAQGAIIAGAGVALGLVGAFLMVRVLETLLFGVSAIDPLTFVATAALMVVVALLASYLPARRASVVDPVEALARE
jgi:putative ABC transport system permease protein